MIQKEMKPRTPEGLGDRIAGYLDELCVRIGERPTGSPGNRAAAAFIARTLLSLGWRPRRQEFSTWDWKAGSASLVAGGARFSVRPAPYAPGCRCRAELIPASTLAELERADMTGKIALIHGELAKEQLMPKNFPFYNPEEHRMIVGLLEAKRPAAIVAATGRNPGLAGAGHPFPLIEDGAFDIPSVTLTAAEGRRLLAFAGRPVAVENDSRRRPGRGGNVVAEKSGGRSRIVFTAHFDAKAGTPGALDNGSGVAVLLALAELLAGHRDGPTVEIVALNGEDHYSAAGQKLYLQKKRRSLPRIALAVNIDGAGHRGKPAAYSLYGCPKGLAARIDSVMKRHPSMRRGRAWPQGDHMVFAQAGRPAAAITSADLGAIGNRIAHTAKDTVDLVDPGLLADVALALRDLVPALAESA